jgi:response regulator NasT
MKTSLRIAVADDEPRMREFYQEMLPLLGHTVVCAAASGTELIERCRQDQPDLVITDIKMPGLDGLEAAQQVTSQGPIPIILVSAYDSAELRGRAGSGQVFGYLIKPIKRPDLQPAISIAMSRFEEFQAVRRQTADLRQALQERKLIERAKGMVMKRAGIDEAAAFARMQQLAGEHNRKLTQIAEMILTAEEALGKP